MMGFIGPLIMLGGGGIPGSFMSEINCCNRFKLISGDSSGGAEAGPGS